MSVTREVMVGILFFAAMFILATITVVYGGIHVMKPPFVLNVQFDTVSGLVEGNKIRVAGLDVGTVRKLELVQDQVLAQLDLNKEVTVHDDYLITVKPFSPFGGRYVDLYLGSAQAPEIQNPSAKVLKGKAAGDLVEELTELLERNADNIAAVVQDLARITGKVASGEGTVGRLLFHDELYEEVRSTLGDARLALLAVRDVMDEVREGEGTVSRLLTDPALYDQAMRVTREAGDLLESVNKGEGTVSKLIHDPELYVQARDALTRLNGVIEKIDRLAQTALTPEGSFYLFLTDGALYRDLSQTATTLKGLLAQVDAGQGTLGKFWKDEALYNDVRRIVEKLEKVLEDYREQAPISTFWGAVFSAF